MTDDPRLQLLLDELLASGARPEDVCRDCPELLPEVRTRWGRMCQVQAELDALFPATSEPAPTGPLSEPGELPCVPGYEIEAVLGRGGMGVVYRARHLRLNRVVALKTSRIAAHAGPVELARFQREAEAAAALRHPNIVQMFDIGDVDGRPYYTMEFVEGGGLDKKLAGRPQPAAEAAGLIATLASAIQFAHKSGFVHRDLKPANIVLTPDGVPKITDFGLARPIQDGQQFTLSGTRLGTPSYMAPEQAMGKTSAVGPASDVYSLGAMLYEMLTGRPPFVGESAVETERQVIFDDPVPPSRLNAAVPRDLETVCLKCLEKQPARRYASAQDLADDLHRFLDGKPITARPVGIIELMVKWARRRPVLTTLLAALLVVLAVMAGAVVWHERQEWARRVEQAQRVGRAQQAAEAAIDSAYQAGLGQFWKEAGSFLAEAERHLPEARSEELAMRVTEARKALDFAERLEGIRQRATIPALDRHVYDERARFLYLAEGYEKEFAREGIDIEGDVEENAAKIRASVLREQTLAALDEWAFAVLLLKRRPLHRRLLRLARVAGPATGWCARFRDDLAWGDKAKLLKLADDAHLAEKPPAAHQLALTAGALKRMGDRSAPLRLLGAALRDRPSDFWLNWEMSNVLSNEQRFQEAVAYARVVRALRPNNRGAVHCLVSALIAAGECDEAITTIRRSIEQGRANGFSYHLLSYAMAVAGRGDRGAGECRRALVKAPNDFWLTLTLAFALIATGQDEEACKVFERAIHLDVSPAGDSGGGNTHDARRVLYFNLGGARQKLGHHEEAVRAFRESLKWGTQARVHFLLGTSLQRLGKHLDAVKAFQKHIESPRESRRNWWNPTEAEAAYIHSHVGLIRSLLCLGQFKSARTACQRALEMSLKGEKTRTLLRRQLEIASELASIEARLPGIVASGTWPDSPNARLALAEWLYGYRRLPAASARLAEATFTRKPALADNLDAQARFRAGCAAALAGCGQGEDAATLNDEERAAFRQLALVWLKAEHGAWARRQKAGKPDEQAKVARKAREWKKCEELACVREEAMLSKLPEMERRDWAAFWADVAAMEARDPLAAIERARAHAMKKAWAEAAEQYARAVKLAPATDGNAWFEYAAVQLLSGDRDGYNQTCKLMDDSATGGNKVRRFLVFRAWTLVPRQAVDIARLSKNGTGDLTQKSREFWALTEMGATYCRYGQLQRSVGLFKQSMDTDASPGRVVLNWLWLAIAHHKMAKKTEARRWLLKATKWLDMLGDHFPPDASTYGLHLHDWLEAQVLRREAELLPGLSPKKGDKPAPN